MKTLEEILQEYFGCKKPFRKDNGDLTKAGSQAYSKLTTLLYDIAKLTETNDEINEVVETLDIIISHEF